MEASVRCGPSALRSPRGNRSVGGGFHAIAHHRHDDALIDDLVRQNIAYVPFFPLGGFTPIQSSTLSSVAEQLGATPIQVALAWLLHRSPNILLIPGTSSLAHLRENLAAGQVALSSEVLAELDGIAAAPMSMKH